MMPAQQMTNPDAFRMPYPARLEKEYGLDRGKWKALTEAIFPAAKSVEAVEMAMAYCKARNLDVFKRPVHIVPIWDSQKRALVETVWPGIAELRTTAMRTGVYAGRDETKFGPDVTRKFRIEGKGNQTWEKEITYPEWAQITLYRVVKGTRVPFPGPRVYWSEVYASGKGDGPNTMWQKRPRGQLDKCAEAAALRAAFPEEIGDEYTEAEAEMMYAATGGSIQNGAPIIEHDPAPKPQRENYQTTPDGVADSAPADDEPADAPATDETETTDTPKNQDGWSVLDFNGETRAIMPDAASWAEEMHKVINQAPEHELPNLKLANADTVKAILQQEPQHQQAIYDIADRWS